MSSRALKGGFVATPRLCTSRYPIERPGLTQGGPIIFILVMAAAAALLIWAVRLVRTDFERAFGGSLWLWLRRSTANRLAAAATGTLAAALMQSSTAVAVLMAGFLSAGAIGSMSSIAILLGLILGLPSSH